MVEFVFISQPMRDKTNEEIYNERREVVEKLEKEGYKIMDSVLKDDPPQDSHQGVFYLGQSIMLLALADCAYFMDGWDKARGCIAEHYVAVEYGIPILYE